MSHVQRAAGLVLVAFLAVVLAGCGGDKPNSQGSASSTPSATTSSTSASPNGVPSPPASPSASAKPLSRFENLGPVKGARAWNVLYAHDMNDRDYNFTRTKKRSTSTVQLKVISMQDVKYRQIYPGPTPFTPVRIVHSGSTVQVFGCAQLGGWTLDRATKKPHARKKIVGVRFDMTKTGGVWKVAALYTVPVDCRGVTVTRVPFPAS